MNWLKMRCCNPDALGVMASTLCILHCVSVPVLLTALPFVSTSIADATAIDHAEAAVPAADQCSVPAATASGGSCCPTESNAGATTAQLRPSAACCDDPRDFWIHAGLLGIVAPLGIVALGLGFRRHRSVEVLGLGLLGVLLLSAALIFGRDILDGRGEQLMSMTGSACMITAHLWNKRVCRCLHGNQGHQFEAQTCAV